MRETRPPGSSRKVLWSFSSGVHTGDPSHKANAGRHALKSWISPHIDYVPLSGPPGENVLFLNSLVLYLALSQMPLWWNLCLSNFGLESYLLLFYPCSLLSPPKLGGKNTNPPNTELFPPMWTAGGKVSLTLAVCTIFYSGHKYFHYIFLIGKITAR